MIISAGELLVEFVSHQTGCRLSTIANYSGPYPSGAPAIFIDQAARMGAKTVIYGGVGVDAFGNALLARLKGNGVDVEKVERHRDRTTGVAFVSYFDDGSRTFIFHLGNTAADAFTADELLKTDEPITMHISGSSLGSEPIRRAILALKTEVLAAGGRLSFDPNVRPELMKDQSAADAIALILEQSAILLPSEADLDFLFPDQSHAAVLEMMLGRGADVVALKRGERGVFVATSAGEYPIPPYQVESVDPTGAGDCFCGTFVALLDQGKSVQNAGLIANAAGAISVTRRGPMEGNANPGEINAFMASSTPQEI